ncbi:MAG: EVE domain-containing protein [Archaeoglobus sp.]|uniref:EVE domain-containing protein n=1 Tax=Archaeoglobus sp. TaxID=1872626 RepID=UPI001D6950FD|nr:EVE domain-containing protein [Archaeoglobus sp.]MBO8180196.1 EVE domain-containing protein [Archaeoglobus sp.]
MAYWLCITNEDNWEVIKQKNIWGVQEKHRNTIAKVKPGDKCLIYVMSTKKDDEVIPPRIMAVYEVASEVFKDSSRIFKPPARNRNETFPLRIKLKPIKIFEKPIDFKSLIPKLKFIANKKKWTGHIQGKAMREIPEEDYRLIVGR